MYVELHDTWIYSTTMDFFYYPDQTNNEKRFSLIETERNWLRELVGLRVG